MDTKDATENKPEEPSDFYSERTLLPDRYYSSKYTNDRRSRVIVIGCCMRKYAPFCELPVKMQESYIRRIERSCYNYACASADKKNVPRNWQNNNFQTLYNIIAYRVQKNLLWSEDDPGSEYLIDAITKGEFDVNNIGKMKSRHLRPSKTKHI